MSALRRRLGPVAVGALALTTLLSLFGRHAWLLDLLTFGRQHLAVISVVLVAATAPARRWRLALVALACAAVNGVSMLPAPTASVSPAAAAAAATPVRVLSLNLLASNPRRNPTLDSLHAGEADIVVLQEFGPRWSRRLRALAELYPYSFPPPDGRYNSNVIFSRYPLVEAALLDPSDPHLSRWNRPIRAVADIDGRELVVYVVHPPTPRSREQWRQRNAELMWLGSLSRSLDGRRTRLMAGDFNTPPWSFLFGDLIAASGLGDASGGGLRMPTRQPRLLTPYLAWLGAPVDHVLVSPDIMVTNYFVGANTYSDHLPVIADLLLPPGRAVSPPRRALPDSAASSPHTSPCRAGSAPPARG